MATDVTTLLIQMIEGGGAPTVGLAIDSTLLAGASDLLSTAANYAQLLGTAAGPLAQDDAATELANIALQQVNGTISSGAAAEAYAAIAASESWAGAAAIVVLFLSFILAELQSAGQAEQTQQFEELLSAINADLTSVTEVALAQYWQDKMTGSLSLLWSPLGVDLDNLAREGTGGVDVTTDVSHFHDHALAFVNHLVSDIGWEDYWQVPAQPAGDVPQSSDPKLGWGTNGWLYFSWYGQFPTRSRIANSPSGNVSDPRTMAPVLTLGLRSYVTIESLLNVIDKAQPTLLQFVSTFRGDLHAYMTFLYGMYSQAVNGIVKTDLPSEDEILGTLWWMTQIARVFAHPTTNPTQPTSQSWGAPWPFPSAQPGPAFSGNGWAWNLIYGASETYPRYGFYGNAQFDQAQANLFTPAYIVSTLDGTNAVSQWQQSRVIFNVGPDTYASIETFQNWTIPWVKNRIILGSMARWKAIYLLNGFDGVWSVLQALQQLAGPNPGIVPVKFKDGTTASGNWSTRELFSVVQAQGRLLDGLGIANALEPFLVYFKPNMPGYSVSILVSFLDNIANGNWAGPSGYSASGSGPGRPLSFRDRLAVVAL